MGEKDNMPGRGAKPMEEPVRKTIFLPKRLWQAIDEFRFRERIGSESEAVRRLIRAGLGNKPDEPASDGRKGKSSDQRVI